jgi:iron complex transport system substrate-binding protein
MFRKLTFVLAILAIFLAACGPVATPAATVFPTDVPAGLTFTDGLGRAIKLAGPAQRIVSLAPSNTEILFAVGAGAQVVGCDDFSDFPEAATALPKIGSLDKQNIEQIVALKPDLVLAAEINSPEQVKALESLGLTVYYLSNPKTLEDLYANLEIVAKLTGHEQDTAALVESLKARVMAVDETLKGAASKPVVFYELDSTDPAKPWTIGPGTFVDLLIARAGGANLTTVAGIADPYPQVGAEQIVATDPDLIILGDSMWGVTVESVGQRPGWEKLKAVTGNQVHPFDDNLVSRPGPRLVDGLEALAKLLHPELFK